MIKCILFDLDGTLLPMDQDVFVNQYFGLLAGKLAKHGYEPQALIKAVWSGTMAMIKNSGEKTNEQAFWEYFCSVYGEKAKNDVAVFEEYYENDFDRVQDVCGYNENIPELIKYIKEKGIIAFLATNPIFPAIATRKRIGWAGLSPDDFAMVTTYENCRYSKPSHGYYLDILQRLNATPAECLMVGNDVGDDMVAAELGMRVFLLTDCLINKDNADISVYPNGDINALISFIDEITK